MFGFISKQENHHLLCFNAVVYAVTFHTALGSKEQSFGTNRCSRLQYLQCISNGDTTVLHYTIEMPSWLLQRQKNHKFTVPNTIAFISNNIGVTIYMYGKHIFHVFPTKMSSDNNISIDYYNYSSLFDKT